MPLDRKLVTVGSDGTIYEFLTNNWTQEKEQQDPRIKYRSMAIANETIIANGIEGSQPILMIKNPETGIKQINIDKNLSQVCFFNTMHRSPVYLASTFEGSVLVFGASLTSD